MPPAAFYRLKYAELALILEGYAARRKQAARERREESAWAVSWLLLPHRSKDADPITPAQLMGLKPKVKRQAHFASPEAAARAFVAAHATQKKAVTA
jgi:hypothetical protein